MSTSTPVSPIEHSKRSNHSFLSIEMIQEKFSPKTIKDFKFALSGSIVMILILFHYAWIMKRLIMNRYLSIWWIITYFGIFGANVLTLGYVLLFVLYPIIYKEEIEQDRIPNSKKEE
ncbi:uncharacterized protein AC631_04593 [Debaryomyces fabryi]|uniref:Uncharacterized protein n=1 Tax=Debaryomyces fabryi TaxID=58627 RepID=A0A0V1PU97_9ASCO|nr:uncharacterized protein AC631_04593 [Debaryomyces fabryi]KRZ99652.1 hypothetical protein AC631_04593 [Debaryomyces fabryi]CUM46156.1 unnamed protein product [Debaryomyces fabryi]